VNVVKPTYCEDHRLPILGSCPFCADGVWPTRDVEARADFAGVKLAGTDFLPHQEVVELEDVVWTVGRQLIELERLERLVVAPVYAAKKSLYTSMKRASIDTRTMQRAVMVYLGLDGSQRLRNEAVDAVVAIMRRGEEDAGAVPVPTGEGPA
jgi:hypothetical protein